AGKRSTPSERQIHRYRTCLANLRRNTGWRVIDGDETRVLRDQVMRERKLDDRLAHILLRIAESLDLAASPEAANAALFTCDLHRMNIVPLLGSAFCGRDHAS